MSIKLPETGFLGPSLSRTLAPGFLILKFPILRSPKFEEAIAPSKATYVIKKLTHPILQGQQIWHLKILTIALR
ncbi:MULTISPECIES: hypothetical protein [unclassified Microcoleus]|uniref:hypothetical protein n=1 Tax=unclassified Microcoleus TaxID=2642155 RepID=UPI0025CE5259|nr:MULTISPECIES: hypothetical protein [unclassified Microcoleus]